MGLFLLILSALLPVIQAVDPPNLIIQNQNRSTPPVKNIQVQTPVRVLDIPDISDAKVVRQNGRLRVEVDADAGGFKPDRFKKPQLEKINPQIASNHMNVTELDGVRPKGEQVLDTISLTHITRRSPRVHFQISSSPLSAFLPCLPSSLLSHCKVLNIR